MYLKEGGSIDRTQALDDMWIGREFHISTGTVEDWTSVLTGEVAIWK